MYIAIRLWRDQRGETSAMAMLLLTTIVALGAIVGLATLRDQMAAAMTEVDELLAATEPAKAVSSEAMLAELLKFEAATARTRVLA